MTTAQLPAVYRWLTALGPLPRMIEEALKLFGTIETPGTADNPTILAWAAETGLGRVYTADSVPWCGLFMALVATRAGKSLPSSPLWALSWSKFGDPGGQPRLGDVLTFKRDGGGHVALYVGEDAACYHVLGGNQSDKVCITRIQKTRLYAVRREYRIGPPASAKPYVLAATGAISGNEA
jgi:uncharacterized protein (TIGR02594 family)